MNKVSNFLIGSMIGFACGAAFGILFAPNPGDETRAKIRSEIERIQEEMRAAGEAKRAELEQELAILRSPRKPGSLG